MKLDERIQELNRLYKVQERAAVKAKRAEQDEQDEQDVPAKRGKKKVPKPDAHLTQQVYLCNLLHDYVVADTVERVHMLLSETLGLAAFANATRGLEGEYLTQFELDCRGTVGWNKSDALEVEIGEIKMTAGKNQRKKASEQLTRSLLLYRRVARCIFGDDVPITLTGTTFIPKRQGSRYVPRLRKKVNVADTTILLQTEFL